MPQEFSPFPKTEDEALIDLDQMPYGDFRLSRIRGVVQMENKQVSYAFEHNFADPGNPGSGDEITTWRETEALKKNEEDVSEFSPELKVNLPLRVLSNKQRVDLKAAEYRFQWFPPLNNNEEERAFRWDWDPGRSQDLADLDTPLVHADRESIGNSPIYRYPLQNDQVMYSTLKIVGQSIMLYSLIRDEGEGGDLEIFYQLRYTKHIED